MPCSGQRRLRGDLLRTAVACVVVAVGAYLVKGANTTAATQGRHQRTGASPSRVAGFDQIAFTVIRAADGGATTRHCGLLALTTSAQQDGQGLMQPDGTWAGYDGMLFQFVDPTTVEFYMKDTLIPLSIAWFDHAGTPLGVGGTDMPPCPTGP